MASDAQHPTQHVNSKGKDPALVAEASPESKINSSLPDACVICLEHVSERAIALPCRHDQFHFSCLGTWLQQSPTCPLCKTEVKAIQHDTAPEKNESKVFYLPGPEVLRRRPVPNSRWHRAETQRSQPYRYRTSLDTHHRDRGRQTTRLHKEDDPIEFRRRVYREKMFSAYVGANRISRYRNITPASFVENSNLVNRAKTFIRRELQVFDFLNNPPGPASSSSALSPSGSDRRSNNAEFLLEYIVGTLKSVDLKGSTGQAEELLKDFLGRENAKLFLHELEAWLRSPYERLNDWDRHVQYGNVTRIGRSS